MSWAWKLCNCDYFKQLCSKNYLKWTIFSVPHHFRLQGWHFQCDGHTYGHTDNIVSTIELKKIYKIRDFLHIYAWSYTLENLILLNYNKVSFSPSTENPNISFYRVFSLQCMLKITLNLGKIYFSSSLSYTLIFHARNVPKMEMERYFIDKSRKF